MKFHFPAGLGRPFAIAAMALLPAQGVLADDASTPAPKTTMTAPAAMSVAPAERDRTDRRTAARCRSHHPQLPDRQSRDYPRRDQRVAGEGRRSGASRAGRTRSSKTPTRFSMRSRRSSSAIPKGDVTLVEFFDYNCAYCRHAHADMKKLIADDPNLRVVLKQFPILGDGSVAAAQVAVAVLLTAPGEVRRLPRRADHREGSGGRQQGARGRAGYRPRHRKNKGAGQFGRGEGQHYARSATSPQKLNVTGTPSYATKLKVVVGAVGLDALKAEIKAVRDCSKVASC